MRLRFKTLLKAFLGLFAITLLAIGGVLFMLVTADWTESTEILRTASPNGNTIAILYETNGGATTSFGYRIYLASDDIDSSPVEVASIYGAIRNNRGAYGIVPRWVSEDELHIEYYSSLRDTIVPEVRRKSGKPIQIFTKLNINDLSVPPGNMARP